RSFSRLCPRIPPRGRAKLGLLAQVLFAKYGAHVLLHRCAILTLAIVNPFPIAAGSWSSTTEDHSHTRYAGSAIAWASLLISVKSPSSGRPLRASAPLFDPLRQRQGAE